MSVINASSALSDAAVRAAIPALQTQVTRDVSPVWGTDASLVFVPAGMPPVAGSWWLVVLDNSDSAGALGYHDLTDEGLPLGKAFAGADLQLGYQWTVTLSHELVEMLADPDINLTVFMQPKSSTGKLVMREVCDPCEADTYAYPIENILVADFVFPEWFQGFRPPKSAQFDLRKQIDRPLQVLPGGYIGIFDIAAGTGWQQISAPERLDLLDEEAVKQAMAASGQDRYDLRPRTGSRRERRRTPRAQWLKSKPVVLGPLLRRSEGRVSGGVWTGRSTRAWSFESFISASKATEQRSQTNAGSEEGGSMMQQQQPSSEMPSGDMSAQGKMPAAQIASGMPAGDMGAGGGGVGGEPPSGQQRVLVEIRVPRGQPGAAMEAATGLNVPGLQVDRSYQPVPVTPHPEHAAQLEAAGQEVYVVRGVVDQSQMEQLRANPSVVRVYLDTPIAPFMGVVAPEKISLVTPTPAAGVCPIPPCDCSPGTAHGTLADVATYLGADQIWAAGNRGDGIVVGIVDGGISAQGRTAGGVIPNVIGGSLPDWGTVVMWGGHGNMTSTDALGIAPNAHVYDIRIAGGATIGDVISNALAGYQWAINQHRTDGTPQVLSNSWGIFQQAWDPVYATDPTHVFTRKVVEAINEGILVLFAAGNCGDTCPDGRCGSDAGPGQDIWGANGHPDVITVGAVNRDEQFVGYSSEGPAALDPHKPDFCSITHFQGFFPSDSGTSAATPVAAGVVALLKKGSPALTQNAAKQALMQTAKDIGPPGWDQYSGAGIIRAKAAYDLVAHPAAWSGWEDLGGIITAGPAAASWQLNRLDCFVKGTDNAMWHKWWAGAGWSGWESLGGVIDNAPAAVSWNPNRIDCFVRGMDNAMWHKWWDGGAWRGWESLGGIITEGPAVASWAPNRLDCFVKGTDNGLWHKWWDGAGWRGWETLGGVIDGAPAAVSWGPNRIDVFARGMDNAMWHRWWDGAAWRGWESLGGIITAGPAVSSWAPNRLDCFVKGSDNAVWHKWWDGGAWRGWESLGGVIDGQPGAVSWGPNRIDIFVRGMNNHMWHKWWG